MQVGDIIFYDAGLGVDQWEIVWFDDEMVQLVDAYGADIFVAREYLSE
jgi:hypothetical protein